MYETTYHRTFHFNASHLSDEGYGIQEAGLQPRESLTDFYHRLLLYIHGHTFRVDIEVRTTHEVEYKGWIVDDYALQALVNEWSDKNLTFHEDFLYCKMTGGAVRATTENIVNVFTNKLLNGPLLRVPAKEVNVRLYETPEVSASVKWRNTP